jgi:hypothetical protein
MALKDYMDTDDMVTEFFFGLLMALDITNIMRLALIGQPDDLIIIVILVSIVGCNFAWGLADGVMNALNQYYENVKQYEFAEKLRGMPDGAEAISFTSETLRENMSPMESDLVDDSALDDLSATVVARARTVDLEKPAFGKAEYMVIAISTGLNLLAAVPILVAYALGVFVSLNGATALANIVGLVMLFLIGYFMGKRANSRRSMWAGFLMVGIGLIILVVVIAMGG